MANPTPAPPKPIKPKNLKFVRATFPYKATAEDELSFNEGDLLYILESSDNSWWRARCKGIFLMFFRKNYFLKLFYFFIFKEKKDWFQPIFCRIRLQSIQFMMLAKEEILKI